MGNKKNKKFSNRFIFLFTLFFSEWHTGIASPSAVLSVRSLLRISRIIREFRSLFPPSAYAIEYHQKQSAFGFMLRNAPYVFHKISRCGLSGDTNYYMLEKEKKKKRAFVL